MAIVAGLLLAMVFTTAIGAIAAVAGLERRASAAQEMRAHLRLAVDGALVIMARDIEAVGYATALEGWGSPAWRRPFAPTVDINALTLRLQQQTMLEGAHGADTPVWQVYAFGGWSEVSGHPSRVRFVGWAADDWEEKDGNPRADSNGRLLLRVRALAEPAGAWSEGLCEREPGGRVTLRHIRTW